MRRVRIGIIGAGATTEWAVLPALSGPDAVAPPDTGSWWGRRAGSASDIRYQAPARPEIVALCDEDGERARRVGEAARIRAVYTDWRLMLREVEMDALLCLVSPTQAPEIIASAGAAVRWIWIDGPPALSSWETMQLARRLEGRSLRVWCSHSLRQAAAHRAAWRLIERGTLGEVCALNLRWSTPLHCAPAHSPSLHASSAPLAAPRAHPNIALLSSDASGANSTDSRGEEQRPAAGTSHFSNPASGDHSDILSAGKADADTKADADSSAARRMSTHAAGAGAEHDKIARDVGSQELKTAVPDAALSGDAPYLAASYAALDMLLAFAAPLFPVRGARSEAATSAHAPGLDKASGSRAALGTVARVMASSHGGASNVWLQFASGASATALFVGAESWNAPFPRLEVCGTQGRSLVCEAGRRLWLHQPREASHFLEPPGLAAHVSHANTVGLAEDLKSFLAAVAESNGTVVGASNAREDGFATSGQAAEGAHSLTDAARVLSVLEAVGASLRLNAPTVPTPESDLTQGSREHNRGAAKTTFGASAPSDETSPRVATPGDSSRAEPRQNAKQDAREEAASRVSTPATTPATLPLPL